MALNWKIKLTKKTLIYGNETGNSLDDLDKIATALGITKDQCHEQITSIKVKKIDIWSAENIDAIQFTYSVDTKDKKGVEVLGNKHGGTTGTLQTWTFASDWLVRVNGKRGDYTTQGYYNIIRWLQFKSFYVNETNHDTWQGEKGTNAGTDFNMIAPACFFSRGGNLVYAFGCYQGELYNADAKIASDNLKTWTETFKPKTADQIKKDLEAGTTATTDLSKWTGAFPNLTADQVLTKYNEPKEIHTDYDKIKGDLENWTNTFKNLTPDQVLTKYNEPKETHTDADLKPKEYDQMVSYWNDNISKDYELPVFGLGALTDLKNHLNSLLQTSQANHALWQQYGFDKLFGEKIDKDSLQKIKDKLDTLDNQSTQQGTQSTQYLNKLLNIYKTQITDETIAFYQALKILDNNEVNANYGNLSVSYLDKLKDLKGESDPDQVINAFKYVVLILATQKAQKESDDWIGKPVAKTPAFKKMKFNNFKRIKDAWDNMEGVVEPTETNNPLYLSVITQKQDYINKINNIISLWQP